MTKPGMTTMTAALILAAAMAETAAAGQPRAVPPREPMPAGKRIVANDGDVIVVADDARVRFVRQRAAVVRLIFNPVERWVVLLADFVPKGGSPDGRVDYQFNWRQIEGTWPLPERWEGPATIEDYSMPGQGPSSAGIVLPAGRVQFLSGQAPSPYTDPTAYAVLHHRSGGGGTSSGTFDEAEQRVLGDIQASAQGRSGSVQTTFSAGAVTGRAVVEGSPSAVLSSSMQTTITPGPAPVRVGGSIPMPHKTFDVPAIYPETARAAGLQGVVVLEITVGPDGIVSQARVLRGQPLLDQAAIDAARQWRYEPTLQNGTPVAVRFTATVDFRQ
jgi:TonB family protein